MGQGSNSAMFAPFAERVHIDTLVLAPDEARIQQACEQWMEDNRVRCIVVASNQTTAVTPLVACQGN